MIHFVHLVLCVPTCLFSFLSAQRYLIFKIRRTDNACGIKPTVLGCNAIPPWEFLINMF